MNRVFLFGNLGADPDLRMTSGGTAVLNLRVATSERYKDKQDVWQDRTEWHSVVVWGKRAEALAKLLSKGSKVLIEGGLRTSSYDARDGVKRYKTEIHATEVKLAGAKAEYGESDERPARSGKPATDRYGSPPDESDLPF